MRNGRSCRAWIGPHLHFVHVHQWTKVHQLTWIHKIVLWVLWCKSLFCNYNPQWRFVNTFDLHHAKEGQSLFLGWNPEHSAAYVFPSTAACQTFSFGLFSVTCSIERCWRPPHDSIKRQIKSTTKKRGFPDRHTELQGMAPGASWGSWTSEECIWLLVRCPLNDLSGGIQVPFMIFMVSLLQMHTATQARLAQSLHAELCCRSCESHD